MRQALTADRTLVKTSALRGTLHLPPAADLPTWTAALGTRTFAGPRSWYDYHGVTPGDVAVLQSTAPRVLTGTPMSNSRPRWWPSPGRRTWSRGCCRLGRAAQADAARGQLAFGPPDGRTVTFVAPRGVPDQRLDLTGAASRRPHRLPVRRTAWRPG